jgi:hypothetical protein
LQLLGWPIQFVGVMALPVLTIRYYVEKGNDMMSDLEGVVVRS